LKFLKQAEINLYSFIFKCRTGSGCPVLAGF